MFVAPHSASDSVQVKAIGKGTAKAHGLGQPGEGGAVTGRERSREGSETGCRTGCRNGRRFSLSPSAQSCHHSTPADVSLSHLPAAASWAMRPLDSTHEHEKNCKDSWASASFWAGLTAAASSGRRQGAVSARYKRHELVKHEVTMARDSPHALPVSVALFLNLM